MTVNTDSLSTCVFPRGADIQFSQQDSMVFWITFIGEIPPHHNLRPPNTISIGVFAYCTTDPKTLVPLQKTLASFEYSYKSQITIIMFACDIPYLKLVTYSDTLFLFLAFYIRLNKY